MTVRKISVLCGGLATEGAPSLELLTRVDSVVSLLFTVADDLAGMQTLVAHDSHVSGRITSTTALIDVATEQMRAIALAMECRPHEAQPRFGIATVTPGRAPA